MGNNWFSAVLLISCSCKTANHHTKDYKLVFNLHNSQSNPSTLFSFDKAHVKAGDQSWALQVNSAPTKTSGVVQQGVAEV